MSEQLQQLVVQQQQRIESLERTARQSAVSATIAGAIDAAGLDLHAGAREQITALLAPEITLVDHGGQSVPCGPGLTPAATHIAQRLASPEFSHFVRGMTTSAPGGNRPAAEPRNLGEQVIQRAQASRPAASTTDPRMDMTRPFGLRAR